MEAVFDDPSMTLEGNDGPPLLQILLTSLDGEPLLLVQIDGDGSNFGDVGGNIMDYVVLQRTDQKF